MPVLSQHTHRIASGLLVMSGLMLEVDVEFSDYGSVLELARGRFGDFSPTGPSMVTRRSNCKLIGPS